MTRRADGMEKAAADLERILTAVDEVRAGRVQSPIDRLGQRGGTPFASGAPPGPTGGPAPTGLLGVSSSAPDLAASAPQPPGDPRTVAVQSDDALWGVAVELLHKLADTGR